MRTVIQSLQPLVFGAAVLLCAMLAGCHFWQDVEPIGGDSKRVDAADAPVSDALDDVSPPDTSADASVDDTGDPGSPQLWVTGYLRASKHASPSGQGGPLRSGEINWGAISQLSYGEVEVAATGELTPIEAGGELSPARVQEIASMAHAHDTLALWTVTADAEAFASAIAPGTREATIENLVAVISDWNFDGLDFAVAEDLARSQDYQSFFQELRQALSGRQTSAGARPLLSLSADGSAAFWTEMHESFDQINLPTYEYSRPGQGWVAWHSSPIYDGGQTFRYTSQPLPSIDAEVSSYLDEGVPPEKLGIAISFYGCVWQGQVSRPADAWQDDAPQFECIDSAEVMARYDVDRYSAWDEQAQASYLGINDAQPSEFVSWDDARAIASKFAYARQKGLGGIGVWRIAAGYRTNQAAGRPDELLQAVEDAWRKTP